MVWDGVSVCGILSLEASKLRPDPVGSAASRNIDSWDQIVWPEVYETVRGLQTRIAKATREQDWRRVKAVQRFLVNSFSAKALAVKRVSENDGKKTPGVDGEIWTTPEAKWRAIQQLESGDIQPQPLRRVYIPKRGSGKMRPLGIPTMIIRAQQALHLLSLEPVAETRADPNSYGFRRNRGTQDAIEQAFCVFAKKASAQWCLEGDITACFDSFEHGWLGSHIPMDKKVLRAWLKAGYVESGKLFPTEAGTPQGGIASPTIANIALDGLEAALTERFGKTERDRVRNKVHFIRYADDFLVSGTSKELLEMEVKPLIEEFLAARGLQLSPTKTIITRVDEGFDFLGQNIRKYGKAGKLLIKPSAKNRKVFLDKVRETIRKNRASKQDFLIHLLNPMIRGWANYHRHIVSSATYRFVDYHIWRALWRWARRRHPEKSAKWVRKKYYRSNGHRHWVFETVTRDRRGQPKTLRLYSASDTKIVRHTKVKSEANPFDPAWDAYFAERKYKRMTARLLDSNLPKRLWHQQKGCCPVCGQLIEENQRWAIRPKTPLEASSARPLADFVMLHDSCRSPLRAANGKTPADGSRMPPPG